MFINKRFEYFLVIQMNEADTKTIRLTTGAYKILSNEKKKLSELTKISYSYSDIILAGLVLLDALSSEHRQIVLDLLKKFKKARIASKSEKAEIDIEALFNESIKETYDKLSSEMLKEIVTGIIRHLIDRGFPGAAMEVLMSNVRLFDEYERNHLSFEILAAMAEGSRPKNLDIQKDRG
jgi:hypothetical protein